MMRVWKRHCFRAQQHQPRSTRRDAPSRSSPRFMSNCGNTVIALCNCYGKNTGRDGYRYSRFCELYQRLPHEARRGVAAGAQGGREDVRRLGGFDDSGLRPAHRHGVASCAVRDHARCEQLHLGRGHTQSTDGGMAPSSRACVRTLRRYSSARGS